MKKMTSVAVLAVLLTLSACSKTGSLEGFKDIKFDATTQQVMALGFSCDDDGYCKTAPRTGEKEPSYTLFGKPADVDVRMTAGKVQNIRVTVPMTAEETKNLLEGQYGNAKSFEYETFMGGRAHKTYWLFGNETALQVTDIINEGAMGPSAMMRGYGIDTSSYANSHTTVEYLGKSGTAELMKLAGGNSVDANDT